MRKVFLGSIAIGLWFLACSSNPSAPPVSDGDVAPDGDRETVAPDGDAAPDGDHEMDAPRCPPGFQFDETLGMCRPIPRCPDGFEWNENLGLCRPIAPDGDMDSDAHEPDSELEMEDDWQAGPDPYDCAEAGLTVRAFIEAESSTALFAHAADFSVPTLRGDWRFSEAASGCDNYLFIQDKPRQAASWPEPLWSRDGQSFLARLPPNTHVFFVSAATTQALRDDALAMIRHTIESAARALPDDQRSHWYHRIHYIPIQSREIEGWLGQVLWVPGWGIGIDRFQRIRYIGSYADPARYNSSAQWFAPNLSMAANEARYYNFESTRETEIEARNDSEVQLFNGELISDPGWAGKKSFVEVALPDAATISAYDTLHLDLTLGCEGDGEYGDCPAWDYIVHLYLCDRNNPDDCSVEFGRWITTYHRIGRWVHDVSGLLPLLKAGGTRRFAFYSQQPYLVDLSLRFSHTAKSAPPAESVFLFSGGAFNDSYNDNYDAKEIAIPAWAEKVELATVISGHGQQSPGNCAEFCVTTHEFLIDEQRLSIALSEAATQMGCMDQVNSGTVPNQYGTWWYGRSGWCPGKEVRMETRDITAMVTPGASTRFDYEGYYRGAPYTSGGANIVMSSWLVFSGTPPVVDGDMDLEPDAEAESDGDTDFDSDTESDALPDGDAEHATETDAESTENEPESESD